MKADYAMKVGILQSHTAVAPNAGTLQNAKLVRQVRRAEICSFILGVVYMDAGHLEAFSKDSKSNANLLSAAKDLCIAPAAHGV
jgi:hypothetical protein